MYTFTRYAKFVYWDPEADDSASDIKGAFRYLYGGRGFKRGEVPSDIPWHCYSSPDAKPDTTPCNSVTWISRDSDTKSW